MNALILGMLTETPIHVGGSQGAGVVDLPVAREGGTDYPFIPGSGLKGALRDRAQGRNDRDSLFGTPEYAGGILVGDARLLLLPVRSLTGTYRWATCPHILERYSRDLRRAGIDRPELPESPGRGEALGPEQTTVFLEEREFETINADLGALAESLGMVVGNETARQRIKERLLVLHDDDFAWFARYGLPIQARNVLEEETKKSKNLWYEEALPPDTVLYSVIAARESDALGAFDELFPEVDPYLQVGANETVGQGWCLIRTVKPVEGSA